MADFLNPAKRSSLMSRIRSRGNMATELRLIHLLKAAAITGWRRNQKVFGKPDFVFRKNRLALFVDGCFWHGCPSCYKRPKSNQKFWDAKVVRNRDRDRKVSRELRRLGWRVIRIWEHELAQRGEACARRIARSLLSRPPR
jgi:DNA mismatch endonuclease, patch repair protein